MTDRETKVFEDKPCGAWLIAVVSSCRKAGRTILIVFCGLEWWKTGL